MVGLVIVSHSRQLARSLIQLIQQVARAEIPLAFAAGVGENRSEFGTDAVEIAAAIQEAYSPDGVLVLMDLGSAILSAELSLELLPLEIAEKVRFCAAPLVEGAIAAAVQAGLGSDLNQVCDEARSALIAKAEQLGQSDPAGPPATAEEPAPPQDVSEIVLTLTNEHGLHARPAAQFVQTANQFQAEVTVRNLTSGKGPVSARSLNALARLGATQNDRVGIAAHGPDKDRVLKALQRLVSENFGEIGRAVPPSPDTLPLPDEPAVPEDPIDPASLVGVPVSEGVALGPLEPFKPRTPIVPTYPAENPELEWRRLSRALEETREGIQRHQREVRVRLGAQEAAIFEAHMLILDDPELHERVRRRIFDENLNAARAWDTSVGEIVDEYRSLEDPYLRQRAQDVEDVGDQLLLALVESETFESLTIDKPVILFAQDLTPTQTVGLEEDKILGLVTLAGGPTSHSAILARALGIPAVAGVDAALNTVSPGTQIGLDGFRGRVWVDPEHEIREELSDARESWLARRERLRVRSAEPARTQDGRRIEVAANVGSLADATAAARNGAEGVGLLRTEFLYLTRGTPPDEEEQIEQLRSIARALPDRPLIVRTLDVGGDKELPYLDQPPGINPFLGVRAIRLAQANPDLLQTQLRAILRAAADHPLRVMFPLISTLEEVRFARRALTEAHETLETKGLPHEWPLETGIMVETPAAALISSTLAGEVDFFSVGTNDLTQYTLAAERGNAALATYQDALHPGVLRLISEVVQAADARGIWVGVCGELAGDPVAVPVLVGLGVAELSLNPNGIPQTKEIIRQLDYSESRKLAAAMLIAPSAAEARSIATDFHQKLAGSH